MHLELDISNNDVSLTKSISFAFAISFVTGILSTRDNSCLFIPAVLGNDFLFFVSTLTYFQSETFELIFELLYISGTNNIACTFRAHPPSLFQMII